jgi:hypothetical protein
MALVSSISPLPSSWSSLTWQQLSKMWLIKLNYAGESDAALCMALLELLKLTVVCRIEGNVRSGEMSYVFQDVRGRSWVASPREIAYYAKTTLKWFDYPYGDSGQSEKKDGEGKVIQEQREPHIGYVGELRDALSLPVETVTIKGRVFALPQIACNNLTWQQYRALQAIAPQLWQSGIGEDEIINLQAQFMANILVPRSVALFEQSGGTIRLRPHFTFRYNVERAETLVGYWRKRLLHGDMRTASLFHICHQVWQTALLYYSRAYPLLFADTDKGSAMKDALQGEVGTINTIMKYAGYAEQQQVYDSNLPFVFDILNTMTKEAKEIENMNAKYKQTH